MNKKRTQPFHSVLIYGMGMMGTSLALAIKQASGHVRIGTVLRSKKNVKYIESLKLAHQIVVCSDPTDGYSIPYNAYELVVFTMPILSFLRVIPKLPSTSALITDVSSSQMAIQQAFQSRDDLRFVSSHPLCGSEKQGPQAANCNLFQSKLCLLSSIKTGRDKKYDLSLLQSFWQSLGMRTHLVDAKTHDNGLAYLSHCPHLISSALAIWANTKRGVHSLQKDSPLPVTGGGFYDMLRIAGSNPKMWADILQTNHRYILSALEEFEKEIGQLVQSLKDQGPTHWTKWFDKAGKMRNKLYMSS